MDNPHDDEQIAESKKELETNGAAAATAMIQTYLDKLDNVQLNIAITGESGPGKSSFVNAFRGIPNSDKERAAPTGFTETTTDVTPYPHPNYPNVTLWDLPGIGTTKFPAEEYLKKVEFKRFDFFIIISADRFTENDVKLAEEIQKMGKKFYFVRSKIDHNIRDEKRDQGSEFNEEKTLKEMREECIKGLKGRVESPQVFLVASRDLRLYDFHLLKKTLEEELPAHKRTHQRPDPADSDLEPEPDPDPDSEPEPEPERDYELEPSCVSFKSDRSKEDVINFKDFSDKQIQQQRPESPESEPEPSWLSFKTDQSKQDFIYIKQRHPSDRKVDQESSEVPIGQSAQQHQTDLDSIFMLLCPDYPECSERKREDEEQGRSREAFLKITLHFLRRMKQDELADCLQSSKRISPKI
ncbi:T-cell-specific guanine nucleotide triphosphate-binding protein 2-like isoform X1 [Perca fluviatilis]|uniref:T-cell-specific guanine nucleotide triphosphate-binding protein 2-like isoform X1 n=1 Tax=Perca fluviatilis TaxID=8168 RepID=UPI0019660087|nr:T-cell-specific guanine nucleotide triphosphate-binding protein 2-like isoform X1 [Perca fluviatilis]